MLEFKSDCNIKDVLNPNAQEYIVNKGVLCLVQVKFNYTYLYFIEDKKIVVIYTNDYTNLDVEMVEKEYFYFPVIGEHKHTFNVQINIFINIMYNLLNFKNLQEDNFYLMKDNNMLLLVDSDEFSLFENRVLDLFGVEFVTSSRVVSNPLYITNKQIIYEHIEYIDIAFVDIINKDNSFIKFYNKLPTEYLKKQYLFYLFGNIKENQYVY